MKKLEEMTLEERRDFIKASLKALTSRLLFDIIDKAIENIDPKTFEFKELKPSKVKK